MGNQWVIVERNKEEYDNDGIRFKAFPIIDDAKPEETVEIVVGEGERHWIVQEVSSKKSDNSQDDYCDACRRLGETTCPGTRNGCWEQF